VGNERLNMPDGLMFSVKDYIMLVEDTGRIIRDNSVVPLVQTVNIPSIDLIFLQTTALKLLANLVIYVKGGGCLTGINTIP
jgi:hypothetical protein